MSTRSVLMLIALVRFVSTTKGELAYLCTTKAKTSKFIDIRHTWFSQGFAGDIKSCRLKCCVVGQAILKLQTIVMPQAMQEPLAR